MLCQDDRGQLHRGRRGIDSRPRSLSPTRREYFWILPDTPGTYYVVTSTGNHISATAGCEHLRQLGRY